MLGRWVAGVVAAAAMVLSGAEAASAATWAYGDPLGWGGTLDVSTNARPVVDPSDHTLYVAQEVCGPKGNCTSTSFATAADGTSRVVDGFCEALHVPDHLFSCPAFEGVARYRAGTRLDTVPVGGAAIATAVDPGDGTVWALVRAQGEAAARELVALDGTTVTRRVALPWGVTPATRSGLAVDPDTHDVWLAGSLDGGDGIIARVADGAVAASAPAKYGVTPPQLDPASGQVLAISFNRLIAVGRDGTVTDRGPAPVAGDVVVAGNRDVILPTSDEAGGVVVRGADGTTTTLDPPNGFITRRLAYDAGAGTVVAVGGGGSARTLEPTDAPTLQLGRTTGAEDADLVRYPVAVFSEAMDRASTEAAFSVRAQRRTSGPEDAVAGGLVWIGDRVAVFVPDEPLPYGARWTVSVSSAARSEAGAALFRAHAWEFRTRNVGITVFPPTRSGTPADTPIFAVFDQPVDHAFVSHVLWYEGPDGYEAVPGRAAWLTEQVLTFAPDEPLRPGGTYLWSVRAGDPARADRDESERGTTFTVAP